ncbi:hypothetical protein ACIQ1D_19640 [Lysinibacillus xylanilyticus]|uniref:hypothetical protein n=1 Tax=Lysinibacillus xylanilyticus TaxID=582475 RepID=UPI00381E53EE
MQIHKLRISKIQEWEGEMKIETKNYIDKIQRYALVLILDGKLFYITEFLDSKEEVKGILSKAIKCGYFEVEDYTRNSIMFLKKKNDVLQYFIIGDKVFANPMEYDYDGNLIPPFELGDAPRTLKLSEYTHLSVIELTRVIKNMKRNEEVEINNSMADAYKDAFQIKCNNCHDENCVYCNAKKYLQ